jgi:hypothetical protein
MLLRFLMLLFEISRIEIYCFVQVGNLKPTCMKTNYVWVTVLADYVNLFYWLVEDGLHFILTQSVFYKELFYSILSSFEDVFYWIHDSECTFSDLFLIFEEFVEFSILTKGRAHWYIDLIVFIKLSKLMCFYESFVDNGKFL